jgi:hypothetical protein
MPTFLGHEYSECDERECNIDCIVLSRWQRTMAEDAFQAQLLASRRRGLHVHIFNEEPLMKQT